MVQIFYLATLFIFFIFKLFYFLSFLFMFFSFSFISVLLLWLNGLRSLTGKFCQDNLSAAGIRILSDQREWIITNYRRKLLLCLQPWDELALCDRLALCYITVCWIYWVFSVDFFFVFFSFFLRDKERFWLNDNSYGALYPDTQSSSFSCHVHSYVSFFSVSHIPL